MELKYGYGYTNLWSIVSFNRTFMELKFTGAMAWKDQISVLIVPLWN